MSYFNIKDNKGHVSHSFINDPQDSHFLIVKQHYLMICEQNMVQAIILFFIEKMILKKLDKVANEYQRSITEKDQWVKMSYSFIEQGLMGSIGKRTINREIDSLVQGGLILRKNEEGGICRFSLDFERIQRLSDKSYELAQFMILDNNQVDFSGVVSRLSTHDKMSMVPHEPMTKCQGTHDKMSYPPCQNVIQEVYIEVKEKDSTAAATISVPQSQSLKKETTMSDTEIILNTYAKHPRKLKKVNLSLNALFKKYGDKVDNLLKEESFDKVLAAMDLFLQDQYWRNSGTPIDAFFKQVDRYLDAKPLLFEESIPQSPTPFPVQDEPDYEYPMPGAPPARFRGQGVGEVPVDPERLRARRGTRRNDALGLLLAAKSTLHDDALRDLGDIDAISDWVIECWYETAVAEFTEATKRVPQPASSPLLNLTEERARRKLALHELTEQEVKEGLHDKIEALESS